MDIILDIGEKIMEAAVCIYYKVFEVGGLSCIGVTLLAASTVEAENFLEYNSSNVFCIYDCLSSELMSDNLRFLTERPSLIDWPT